MGNSRTSRYADGKTIHDLQSATAAWLRQLVARASIEQEALTTPPRTRRVSRARMRSLRQALRRVPEPSLVSPRRGAGEVRRMLLDPDIAPRLRALARRNEHDEGDLALLWARLRTANPSEPIGEAGPA